MKLAAATSFFGAPALSAPPTFFVFDFMKRAACALSPPAASARDEIFFRISLCDSGCGCATMLCNDVGVWKPWQADPQADESTSKEGKKARYRGVDTSTTFL